MCAATHSHRALARIHVCCKLNLLCARLEARRGPDRCRYAGAPPQLCDSYIRACRRRASISLVQPGCTAGRLGRALARPCMHVTAATCRCLHRSLRACGVTSQPWTQQRPQRRRPRGRSTRAGIGRGSPESRVGVGGIVSQDSRPRRSPHGTGGVHRAAARCAGPARRVREISHGLRGQCCETPAAGGWGGRCRRMVLCGAA